MKRVLIACAAALALVVGVNSKAEAVTATALHICQGATCFDVAGGPIGVGSGLNVTVGDYNFLLTGGAVVESAAFSQSQTIALQVTRTGNTSANPLDVWFQAVGFALPVGPAYTLDTTLGATVSPTNPGAAVDYMAWLNINNLPGFPPPGPGTTATPEISCIPTAASGSDPGSCSVNGVTVLVNPGNPPFSLVTRTQFNIAQGDSRIYGSTAQAVVTSVIPEPMSLMLLGSGLLGLGATARRRRLQK